MDDTREDFRMLKRLMASGVLGTALLFNTAMAADAAKAVSSSAAPAAIGPPDFAEGGREELVRVLSG